MESRTPPPARSLGMALEKLTQEVTEGLRHGFFEFTVTCELVKDRKRRFTIRAGKSHQFNIPEDELKD